MALLVDGVMQKFEIERAGDESMVGAIFKGKIQNLEPGLKAAFVDIGQPKNAFLHYWDIFPTATDNSYEIVRENRSKEQKKTRKINNQRYSGAFSRRYRDNRADYKDPDRHKRAEGHDKHSHSRKVSRPHAVCRTVRNFQKIEDRKERDRIKKILRSMKIPEGMGVIVRTAGQGKRWTYFVRDLHMLLNCWKRIQQRIETVPAPAMIYQEPDLVERTVRDFLTEQTDRILIDSKEDYDRIIHSVSEISRRARSKIQLLRRTFPF